MVKLTKKQKIARATKLHNKARAGAQRVLESKSNQIERRRTKKVEKASTIARAQLAVVNAAYRKKIVRIDKIHSDYLKKLK